MVLRAGDSITFDEHVVIELCGTVYLMANAQCVLLALFQFAECLAALALQQLICGSIICDDSLVVVSFRPSVQTAPALTISY